MKEKGLIEDEYSTDPLETIIEDSINKLENEISTLTKNNSKMKEQNQKIEEEIMKYAKDKYQNKNLPIYEIIGQILSEQNSQIQELNKKIVDNLDNNQEETIAKSIQTFFESQYQQTSNELNSIKIENADLKRTFKEIETIKQRLIEEKSDNNYNNEESASMIIQKSLMEKDHQIELMQTKINEIEELKNQNDDLKKEIISKNQQIEQLLRKNNQLLIDIQEGLQKPLIENINNKISENKLKDEQEILIRRHIQMIEEVNQNKKQRMKIIQQEENEIYDE